MVLGRMFDFQLLDMMELGVNPTTFKPMSHFDGKRKAVVRIDSKPMFVFQGTEFQTNPDFAKFKNLILDYFRGEVLDKVNIAGLDRVIVCSVMKSVICFRQYGIILKATTTKYPQVELDLVGPCVDLTIRRVKSAPSELQKVAMQTPRGPNSAKRKNMYTDHLQGKKATIHPGKQDFEQIAVARLKGLKKSKKPKVAPGAEASPAAPSESQSSPSESASLPEPS